MEWLGTLGALGIERLLQRGITHTVLAKVSKTVGLTASHWLPDHIPTQMTAQVRQLNLRVNH